MVTGERSSKTTTASAGISAASRPIRTPTATSRRSRSPRTATRTRRRARTGARSRAKSSSAASSGPRGYRSRAGS